MKSGMMPKVEVVEVVGRDVAPPLEALLPNVVIEPAVLTVPVAVPQGERGSIEDISRRW